MKEAQKITRGNFTFSFTASGLKACVLEDDLMAILARGILHYDKGVSALLKPAKGAKADSVAYSADVQKAAEAALQSALEPIFADLVISGKERERTEAKISDEKIMAIKVEALKAAGLDDAAIAKALGLAQQPAAPVETPVAPVETTMGS